MSEMRIAGVMGWPVGHSKSPRLFDHWFARYDVAGRYVPLAVAPDAFAEVYRALPKAGFTGVNVTIPHKEAALALADEVTPPAKEIGAANMIRFVEGRILADNTDGFGFLENLRAGAPGWRGARGPALVLGAGGAARAVLHALLADGAPEIRLANRSGEKAEALAALFGPKIQPVAWEDREPATADVATIVNTTSLGMLGQPPLELSLDAAPDSAVVTDIVYAPLKTPLLEAAWSRGLVAVDGLGMLLHQARPAFAAWFDVDPEVDERLRAACLS
ncbi:MAG: shikimate dehydrogenase [Pikeienuella sp.]